MDTTNYSKLKNIIPAILEAHPTFNIATLKPYIWQDELGEIFFLTKKLEFYFYNRTTLFCYFFGRSAQSYSFKLGQKSHINTTDDNLYYFKVSIDFLPQILATGKFRQRPDLKGKWIAHKKSILCHDIIPYRPHNEQLGIDTANPVPPQLAKLINSFN